MIVRNLYRQNCELVHNSTVAAWTFFREEDFLSDVLWFNDNLIEPGIAVETHEHEDVEEVYYVIQGQGKMRIGDEEKLVSEGDAIYLPPQKPHTLMNIGTHPLRFICIGARVKR